MMALVIAMVMVVAMGVTVFADPAYSITVTPSGDGVSIDGKTFNAYKLFDVTYADNDNNNENDAFSYSISTDNYFYRIFRRFWTSILFSAGQRPRDFRTTQHSSL